MAAIRLLRAHDVPFSVLCVVNRENAKRPYDVYRFLTRDAGARRLQFIPCVEPKAFRQIPPGQGGMETVPTMEDPQARPVAPDSIVTDWSVDPEDWGRFLFKIWDDWYRR